MAIEFVIELVNKTSRHFMCASNERRAGGESMPSRREAYQSALAPNYVGRYFMLGESILAASYEASMKRAVALIAVASLKAAYVNI